MPTIPESPDLVSAIPQLEGEVDPSIFMQSDAWLLLAWGSVALMIAAGVGIIWWIRRSKRTQPHMATPLETALRALQQLEEKLPPIRECSLQISLIVRGYLQGQVQDPALYETHEEFSQRLDSLATVPKACQYDTRYLLERLADLKYAGSREQAPVQARTLIEQARALLSRIDEARLEDALNTPPAL